MTRDIKFRAWHKEDKKMVDPKHLLLGTLGYLTQDSKHLELMQYTGLKDKNGVEIYEGDIVFIPDESTEPITDDGLGPVEPDPHFAEVMFGNGTFEFVVTNSADIIRKGSYTWDQICDQTGIDDLEIIGNIYENGDLLK